MKKGLIIVNTGDGKGKTTAALGQAFRAMGYKYKICVIQFIKGTWKYGELVSKDQFKDLLDFHVMGKGFTFKSENLEEDQKIALKGWEIAKAALLSDTYFMVILDELTYLLTYKFIDIDEVVSCIQNRRDDLHVIITGRDAPAEIVDMADLVTEMQVVKHPLKQGIKAQKGIEF
ncbi:MAG: Cob(I)yrinic acid a,c-diamide adenosyltransferase [Candidatus Magnetoglobus multicellularis str. Araruama]|uniref:corrinoid adenosyltransferase n=1 Tax=Candidatus Magnetoglobus multicellularis str. Araruama TaxID=890399 RepID=A0A1V1PCV1_9BACT|nr:MAG: Cob(I)yrinic acid a,c-diamide adenosyltransferase [Candidatus Magnetoglobus multicellularis str. Araruama]